VTDANLLAAANVALGIIIGVMSTLIIQVYFCKK